MRCRNLNLPHIDIVYALATLFDYDLWILTKIQNLGLENFITRIIERAYDELRELVNHYLTLLYTNLLTQLAIHNEVKWRRENLEQVIQWSKTYAEEVDTYLDTVNLLITDEYYEELKNYIQEQSKDNEERE